MFRATLIAGCLSLLVVASAHATCSGPPISIKDGNGSAQTIGAVTAGTNCVFANVIGDGGGAANYAAVKAASTAPVAADPALVVAVSPNTPIIPPGCAGATVANTKVAQINLTASGQVITGVSSKQTYICAIDISVSAADNVALVESSVTNCTSGAAGMNGGSTANTGWNFIANTGLTKGNGQGILTVTTTQADNVCLLVSTGAQVSGVITYAQF